MFSRILLVILELNEATTYLQKKQKYLLQVLSNKYLYVSGTVFSAGFIVFKVLSVLIISCHGLV